MKMIVTSSRSQGTYHWPIDISTIHLLESQSQMRLSNPSQANTLAISLYVAPPFLATWHTLQYSEELGIPVRLQKVSFHDLRYTWVGSAVVQLHQRRGADVIGLVKSEAKVDQVKSYGADEVIVLGKGSHQELGCVPQMTASRLWQRSKVSYGLKQGIKYSLAKVWCRNCRMHNRRIDMPGVYPTR